MAQYGHFTCRPFSGLSVRLNPMGTVGTSTGSSAVVFGGECRSVTGTLKAEINGEDVSAAFMGRSMIGAATLISQPVSVWQYTRTVPNAH